MGSTSSVPILVDLNKQSEIVEGKDRARISKLCKDGQLITEPGDGVTTLYEAFKRGARLSNNGPCYGWKPSPKEPYTWFSYNDVLVKAANIGAGLLKKGLKASNKTFVGIYSQNRVEYGIMEQGCYMYSMVLVPLYDTLGPDACAFIINQADIELVCCDKNVKVQNILNRIKETPQLKIIALIEPPTPENVAKAQECGIELIRFSDLDKLGEQNPVEPMPAKPDDLCVLCYTSGTTGLPKGAMLTHKGTLATVAATQKQLEPAGIKITHEDVLISYLPLAHSYERLLECYLTMSGARIGFFQGDVRMLMDDIKELKPTLFPSVPRLLNRFYDKVVAGTQASAVKQFMFKMAMSSKESELNRGIIRKDSVWDKMVFKKIQDGLGGRVKLITTGSAPLSAKVLQFLRCCVGCPILEGYGQTESHAICSLTVVGDADVDAEISKTCTSGRSYTNCMPSHGRFDDVMKHKVDNLWKASLAKNTQAVYSAGLQCFLSFATLYGVIFSPGSLPKISEELLVYFVTHCHEMLKLSAATIQVYLSGIKYFYIKAGLGDPMVNSTQLAYILRGIKKQCKHITAKRLPITFDILKDMCSILKKGVFSPYMDLQLMCMCQMAFFGFLRCGELTVRNKADDQGCVYMKDITISPDNSYYTFTLRKSKCDFFQRGVTITIHENSSVNPVMTMYKLYNLRLKAGATPNTPLFTDSYKSGALNRDKFLDYLRQILHRLGLGDKRYNGHSFRIGAATTAAASGVEDHVIQTLGRWSSDCYTRYIRTSQVVICQAQKAMCS